MVNGDAEAGTAEGWDGPLAVYQHGVGGYPLSLIVDSSGFTGESYDGGEFLFTGVGPYSIATQSIDLTSAAPAIDNAHTRARISAYLGGHYVQSDRPILHYEFFDEAGALLESRQFGPVLPADRGSASGFIRFEETVLMPPGTRTAMVTFEAITDIGLSDAFIDNVELQLETPAAVAVDDTAQVAAGEEIVVAPLANDSASPGADLVPGSLRLIVEGVETTEAVTPEGVWRVDVPEGTVAFSASSEFEGTVPPAEYRFVDTSGQPASGEIRVDVLPLVPDDSPPKSAVKESPVAVDTVVVEDLAAPEVAETVEVAAERPPAFAYASHVEQLAPLDYRPAGRATTRITHNLTVLTSGTSSRGMWESSALLATGTLLVGLALWQRSRATATSTAEAAQPKHDPGEAAGSGQNAPMRGVRPVVVSQLRN
ncbi:hypothetical protein ACIFNM_00399 [Leucobacter aridicollis]